MTNNVGADFTRRFGETVRRLRIARGWSQSDLAERMAEVGMPLHQTTVAKLEKGRRPTPVDELFALGRVFGLDASSLLYAASDAGGANKDQTLANLIEARATLAAQLHGLMKELESVRQQRVRLDYEIASTRARIDDLEAQIDTVRRSLGEAMTDGQHQEAP